VHLTASQLARLDRRPVLDLVGASCHDAGELARACELGVDFAVLGPVRPTPSHPGAPGIGWDAFAALVRDNPLPVYALGGLSPADLDAAYGRGAHGISMMRGVWT
jgi:8-oxo-dGTP diphosphatase